MKVRHGLIVTLLFLTAVIAMSISSYYPKPESITEGKVMINLQGNP